MFLKQLLEYLLTGQISRASEWLRINSTLLWTTGRWITSTWDLPVPCTAVTTERAGTACACKHYY